ncbi:uncharacterized protein BDZ99DRAFT_576224 [Mytilinidion resinicola]|uniref:Uncharacterized protein n=1 Tax=Mytilinidion resinicola TaxID=574789 RepID=A0A6A6Y3B9_9PEZI|nr:uncharacterized protein BDZ99DRAFT_576224 [Mytilinidion resinicola]KAF2803321.1 hypothetical protein BDZ99DRAFT_576224 [Mytilinidion resinicola]
MDDQAQTSASSAVSPPALPSTTEEPFFPNCFTPYPAIPPIFQNPFDNCYRPERVPSIMKYAAPGRIHQPSPPKRDKLMRATFSVPQLYPWEEHPLELPSIEELHGLVLVTCCLHLGPCLLQPPGFRLPPDFVLPVGFPLPSTNRVESGSVSALSKEAEERLRVLRAEVDHKASQMQAGVAPDQLAAALQQAFDSDPDGKRSVYRRRRRHALESRPRKAKKEKLRDPYSDTGSEQREETPASLAEGSSLPPVQSGAATPEQVEGQLSRDALLELGRYSVTGKEASKGVEDRAYERLRADIPADLEGILLKPRRGRRETGTKEVTWWDQVQAPAEPEGAGAAQAEAEKDLLDMERY